MSAFFFQFKDLFPEHRQVRQTIVVLVTGIFLGTLLSALKGIRVEFGTSIQTSQIVVIALVCVLVLACIVVLFTKDQARRNDIYPFIGVGVFVLLGILLAQGLASVRGTDSDQEQKQISLEEIMQLANAASAHGNYERALMWLESAKPRVINDSGQSQIIQKRELDIRKKQIGEN